MRADHAPRRRPSPPSPDPNLLDALAGIIDRATAGAQGASLWGITTSPDGEIELGLLPITGHPFDELVGFDAPQQWRAMAVRAVGRGRSLDDPDQPPRAVAATMVIGRDGITRSRLRWLDDGGGTAGESTASERQPGPVEGLIADACRRALGLATAPPHTGSAAAWALLWLDRVVERSGDPVRRPRTWAAAVALHPSAVAADPDGTWILADPDGLVEAARAHAEIWHWGRLRREPFALGPIGAAMPAEASAWMDDGLFSRWLLAELPDPAELMGAVSDVLPAKVTTKVIGAARTLLGPP